MNDPAYEENLKSISPEAKRALEAFRKGVREAVQKHLALGTLIRKNDGSIVIADQYRVK